MIEETPWDALAGAVSKLGDKLDGVASIREATVTSLNPVTVQFDTDTTSVSVTGALQNLTVGKRVLTVRLKHYVWVLGVKGGEDKPLSMLSDVIITNPIEGQVLYYEEATAKWKNKFPDGLIPQWQNLTLHNNWKPYNSAYLTHNWSYPQFTRVNGIVQVQGLIIAGTTAPGTVVAQLPPGFRPDTTMMFPVINSDLGRDVRVLSNGQIILGYGGFASGSWVSLDSIIFPAAGVPSWTNIGSSGSGSSFANGWRDFGDQAFGTPRYWKDPDGIVWWAGMISSGSVSNVNAIIMPSSHVPTKISHHITAGNAGAMMGRIHDSSNGSGWQFPVGGNTYVSLSGLRSVTETAMSSLRWYQPQLLGNGAVNYNAATYYPAQYATTSYGLTFFLGLLINGVNNGTVFLAPPVARRPQVGLNIMARNDTFARLDIQGRYNASSPGSVYPTMGSGWYSFDGLALFGQTHDQTLWA